MGSKILKQNLFNHIMINGKNNLTFDTQIYIKNPFSVTKRTMSIRKINFGKKEQKKIKTRIYRKIKNKLIKIVKPFFYKSLRCIKNGFFRKTPKVVRQLRIENITYD